MEILVINSGSSSIKFERVDSSSGRVFNKGLIEKIGMPDSQISIKNISGRKITINKHIRDHYEGLKLIFTEIDNLETIEAVGHRVVNGGEHFSEPCILDDKAIEKIKSCIPLAPLHNPANCQGIEAAIALLPKIPHVAVFDTAFHKTIEEKNYLYAIPYNYYEKKGIRKYGFHGTSHKYVTERAAVMLGKDPGEIRGISCHLGNGASITAIEKGNSVDTSMGYGTLCGIPMGTRPGDLDPAVVLRLFDDEKEDRTKLENILYRESGLKGLSGLSSDMRDLLQAASKGHERAAKAVDVFVNMVQKYIGAYLTQLSGNPDFILFTAGIGENSSEIRQKIINGLRHMGIVIDEELNRRAEGESLISSSLSSIPVLLIPTNEEWMIARETEARLNK